MKALLQRVKRSWVKVDGQEIASIETGLNILLGVMDQDSEVDIDKLIKKIVNLRIFPNAEGRFDRSIKDIEGEALVVSQFTLAANCKRGNRPDFSAAMEPKRAKELYELFVNRLQEHIPVQTGQFGAMMEVGIINDGPVTIILDSKEL